MSLYLRIKYNIILKFQLIHTKSIFEIQKHNQHRYLIIVKSLRLESKYQII